MSPELPKWLPDGWIMETKRRKDGKKDRYYISPVSGRTFRSRAEVMCCLNFVKVDGPTQPPPVLTAFSEENNQHVDGPTQAPPVSAACLEENNQHPVEQGEDSPLWLPNGWIMEMRIRKSGAKAGVKYKTYYDPVSKLRFYSKGEVLRHLKAEQPCNSKHKRKKNRAASSEENTLLTAESSQENVLALIESSPDGLPPGWIKEIKCRRNASGTRKDPYYTDPVSGYVFRSKKDVYRFLETGEISKYAFRKAKANINEVYSIEDESPPLISAKKLKGQETTVRRRLFIGKIPKNRGKAKEKGGEVARASCSVLSDSVHLKKEKTRNSQIEDEINPDCDSNGLPEKPLEVADEAALDQVIEKLLDSVSKIAPETLDMTLLEQGNEKMLEVRNEIPSQPYEQSDMSPLPKKQLDFETLKQKKVVKRRQSGRLKSSDRKSADKVSAENLLEIEEMNSADSQTKEPCDSVNVVPTDSANKKMLEPSEKISELEEKLSKSTNEKITEQETAKLDKEEQRLATGSTMPRQSKLQTKRSASLPRRASKRLAGVEADPAAAIEFSDLSLRPRPRRAKRSAPCETSPLGASPLNESEGVLLVTPLSSKKPEDKEPIGEQDPGRTTNEKPESPIMSPFGDSWPDPCIEFAFKTLTGEIPVLEETTIAQEYYFHQEVSSVQTQNPLGSTTLFCGSSSGLARSDIFCGSSSGLARSDTRVKPDSEESQHPAELPCSRG